MIPKSGNRFSDQIMLHRKFSSFTMNRFREAWLRSAKTAASDGGRFAFGAALRKPESRHGVIRGGFLLAPRRLDAGHAVRRHAALRIPT